jgi:hypothetical protein
MDEIGKPIDNQPNSIPVISLQSLIAMMVIIGLCP